MPFVSDANTLLLWNLDETSGTAVNDSSSNNRDGAITGSHYSWSDGLILNDIAGGPNVYDTYILSDDTFDEPTGEFSFEFSLKSTGRTNTGGIFNSYVFSHAGSTGEGLSSYIAKDETGDYINIYVNNQLFGGYLTDYPIPTTDFVHIQIISDGSTYSKLYWDGVLKQTKVYGNVLSTGQKLGIGVNAASTGTGKTSLIWKDIRYSNIARPIYSSFIPQISVLQRP